MNLRAIALIAFLFVLTVAANAQATRADLPAPDNFLGIATFPLWDKDTNDQRESSIRIYCASNAGFAFSSSSDIARVHRPRTNSS